MMNARDLKPVIQVENFSKSFGSVKAVDNISFQVIPGECFGLLGPNGAGKSTTIKMLITLLPPDAGTAIVNGFSITSQGAHVRESIGYVPQSLSVDGVLTGYENLMFFGKLYGWSEKQLKDRVPLVLELMDLKEAAHRQVAHYSGGMVRRLEIGQAILHQPAVVFLDEPTVGLDPVARHALWKHIQELRRHHLVTLFLTTHYMDEAQELCSHIAIMNHGKIVVNGTLQELRKIAKLPKASMNDLFVRFVGPIDSEKGDLNNVSKIRRIARRLS